MNNDTAVVVGVGPGLGGAISQRFAAGIRGMAESMAREFGTRGIHVAHFNVDGGVGNERKRKGKPELTANNGLISIEALAEAYYQTYFQPRDCWSFDVELRPWNRVF